MDTTAGEEVVWPELQRVRRTIVVADMVESVRLMQRHEDDVIQRWRQFVAEARTEVFPTFSARLVKSLGDGMLLECDPPARAVALAFKLHRLLDARNDGHDADDRIQLRIGLHVADVVHDELDVYGAGVNLAARIAGLARVGGVAASVGVIDELLPGVDAQLEDAGACYLKHIEEPVHVYHVHPPVETSVLANSSPKRNVDDSMQADEEPALSTCVAVMPIEAAQTGNEGVTLAALISDLLVTRLSTRSSMRVISRLSTEQFKLRGFSPGDVARRTGAAFLVAGRLHGDGRHAALHLELIDATTQAVVWAENFAVESSAVMSADEGVTPLIAQAVADRIAAAELRRIQVSPLPNLPSQALQFAAIRLMHRQAHADFERSHEILEHLMDRHPRAAAPHTWLAQWHVLTVTKGWDTPTPAQVDRALGHVRRALDLNPDSAMSLAMEAFVLCHMKKDLAMAHDRALDALAINPNEPWAWLVRTTIDSLLGRGENAWQWALRARRLSPMDPVKHYFDGLAASAAVAAGRYAEAETLARMSLSKDARHLPTLRALAIAQVHLGQIEQARDTVATVLRLQPRFTLERYVADAPAGSQEMRGRWAAALREAGAP